MRRNMRELLSLWFTPIGRHRIAWGLLFRAGLVLGPIAYCARRTIAANANVIAVVGSFGKTTATRAVMAVLGLDATRHTVWNAGGFVAAGLLKVSPFARFGVVEVGISAPGQMARHARWVRPDVVVVMAIGSEHHRSLGTLEATRHEKAEMVRSLRPSGLAVLNGDDGNVIWMREQTDARAITFGLGQHNDVRASDVALHPGGGMRFVLHAQGDSWPAQVRLTGRPMVYPLLAAVAVGLFQGIPLDDMVHRLAALPPTPERLQPLPTPSGALILLDTVKSPIETVEAGLDVLDEIPAEHRLVVLGDVEEPQGSQGPLYKALGRRLARTADRVVYVGGRKSFASVAGGAAESGLPRERVTYAGRDVLDAAAILRAELRPGDVVWIKGRSTQHLGRIGLAVAGRDVRCRVTTCPVTPGCESCVMLERGRSRWIPKR